MKLVVSTKLICSSVLITAFMAGGCTKSPEQQAKNLVFGRFPSATITSTWLSQDKTTVCGEVEPRDEAPRLFFAKLREVRVRVSSDLDVDLGTFMKECSISPGSPRETTLTMRWGELTSLHETELNKEAVQRAAERARERDRQWFEANREGLQTLNDAIEKVEREQTK